MATWLIGGTLAFFSGSWAFVVGLVTGFVLYAALMKVWVLRAHPQAEITSGFDDRYLATSVDRNWVYAPSTGFTRLATKDLPEDQMRREDL